MNIFKPRYFVGGASEAEWRSLKNELQNMATMDHHPNIVNLIGAQTRGGISTDSQLVL